MILIRMQLLGFLLVASQALAGDDDLKTPLEKSSYAIGVNLVGNLRQQGGAMDQELVIQGMRDAFAGGRLRMSDGEIRKYISFYQNEVRNRQARSRTLAAKENKQAGAAFLLENSRKKGVVTLPSGLQYAVLKTGAGKRPTHSDAVEFHYRSSSLKGVELDSSYRNNKPVTRQVKGGVVPGLAEALQLMPVGSQWQLFVPSQLAYGERGNANLVGPHETVIFEVELLAIR